MGVWFDVLYDNYDLAMGDLYGYDMGRNIRSHLDDVKAFVDFLIEENKKLASQNEDKRNVLRNAIL